MKKIIEDIHRILEEYKTVDSCFIFDEENMILKHTDTCESKKKLNEIVMTITALLLINNIDYILTKENHINILV